MTRPSISMDENEPEYDATDKVLMSGARMFHVTLPLVLLSLPVLILVAILHAAFGWFS